MPRQPYCYKRYFEETEAHPILKFAARHWLKMHKPFKDLVDEKLLAIESGAIVVTNLAWYGTDKTLLEGLEAEVA